jgi:SAM-dependent methyltransferase
MVFSGDAEAYDRFMGRFSSPLADRFLELVDPQPGQRALDVGCGPGALTRPLVERLGAASVAAIDPSAGFVATARSRFPGVDVRRGAAEHLPFADASFDLALAQLVVHFMDDPVRGISQMKRVVVAGGLVAASVWDFAPGRTPLGPFWEAVADLDPASARDKGGTRFDKHDLARSFEHARLGPTRMVELTVSVSFETFAEWWQPFTMGVGPVGEYVASLREPQRILLEERCAELLPDAPFSIEPSAWVALAHV